MFFETVRATMFNSAQEGENVNLQSAAPTGNQAKWDEEYVSWRWSLFLKIKIFSDQFV